MEVPHAMATMEEDATGIGTAAAGWEDEDNETGLRTTCENKSWGCQWTVGAGATRSRSG